MSTFTRTDGFEVTRSEGIEVADIFRRHFATARARHSLGPREQRVARDVMFCRTAVLGGHLQSCTSCELQRPAYNSCRNRHCPKCQALRQARWVEQRCSRILPTHCFHVVFTLPGELHGLARRNRALIFDLLMKSAAASLLALGRDPKWLGESAQLGITAVLHTWSRDLHLHPHVHCIVTGGGLFTDAQRWVSAPPDFLFPVRVLGSLFRGKFLAGLEQLRALPNFVDDADTDRAARRRLAKLYDTNWIVFAKRPFGGPEQVYRYLGRYTHRVAISNSRLLSSNDDAVVFRTRDQNTASVTPVEFIRRFLDHVLPPGFVKIRHFGLLSPVNINDRWAQARSLLTQGEVPAPAPPASDIPELAPAPPSDAPWVTLLLAITGIDVSICPRCHNRSLVRTSLPPACRGPPPAESPP
jgi:Putative transposase/Transposase zinc-binding domain